MGNMITTVLASLTFSQIVIVLLLVFIFYMIYMKSIQNDYHSKLYDLKQKYQSTLWDYISQEICLIESISLEKAKVLIGRSSLSECNGACGFNSKESQYNMFSLVLERVLHHDVFEKIKTAIRQNGFHSKSDAEIEMYITDKAEYLLTYSRKRLNMKSYMYSSLKGTEDERFNIDHSIKFYRKMVYKAIELKVEEDKAIKKLKSEYSILEKINFIKKIYNKFFLK